MPSAAALVIKALKEPQRDSKKVKNIVHSGNVPLEEIYKIARIMRRCSPRSSRAPSSRFSARRSRWAARSRARTRTTSSTRSRTARSPAPTRKPAAAASEPLCVVRCARFLSCALCSFLSMLSSHSSSSPWAAPRAGHFHCRPPRPPPSSSSSFWRPRAGLLLALFSRGDSFDELASPGYCHGEAWRFRSLGTCNRDA